MNLWSSVRSVLIAGKFRESAFRNEFARALRTPVGLSNAEMPAAFRRFIPGPLDPTGGFQFTDRNTWTAVYGAPEERMLFIREVVDLGLASRTPEAWLWEMI